MPYVKNLMSFRDAASVTPSTLHGVVFVILCPAPARENAAVKKTPFRLTPYQVQFLLVVGFVTVGYALYLRYLAVEFSTVALACDAGLQSMLCKSRTLATSLFKNSVFGIVALIIATLHVMRPSIVLLTGGLIAAGLGIVLYNIALSGTRDRAAYSGICAARARHSVTANRDRSRRSTSPASSGSPR